MMKKSIFFVFYIVFFIFPLAAHNNTPDLASQILTLAQDRPVLQGTSWSVTAQYVDENTPFVQIHSDLRLAPASTLKLLTSAAALKILGNNYRFQTRIYTDGKVDEKDVLQGNLYIRGGGDPTLGSARVPPSLSKEQLLQNWSQQLRQLGIKKIQGRIYADTSLFSGPSLPSKVNWENMGNYFAAPVTALAFDDNSFAITFGPQTKHGKLVPVAGIAPDIRNLSIQSFVTADAKNPKDNAYVYAAPGQYDLEIHGTLPISNTNYTIHAAQPNAPQLLADLLRKQLQRDGIPVTEPGQVLYTAPDYEQFTLLWTYYSPVLSDIILVLNKRSFNFYAEMLAPSLAIANGQAGTLENGLNALKHFLETNNISSQNMRLYDASGLARDNQITTQTLVDLLVFMSKQPGFTNHYYRSLATPNERGDLMLLEDWLHKHKRMEDVHVKGGTIDGVKAQAGYARDKDGRLIAFSLIANNLIYKDEQINRFYEDVIKLFLENSSPKK